ncbi:MAG: selenium-dependent molybdenum cofactor biosynthesis protein YqeB [Thermodesulfobacteriota bacterium]|nr:selenium-dependent molybdenum cofactor biosynthesis protein YqeB [Thermodesulfobacteriota bacterium]
MSINKLTVLVKSGGEMASGIASRLNRSHFRICMTETYHPQAVRREVSFCEAIYEGEKTVEGTTAKLVDSFDQIQGVWDHGQIPIIVDPETKIKDSLKLDILIDAILAKRNLGTKITDAPLVIGLGPGFYVGRDVHLVVETNRGHDLGRVIFEGEAEKNTGIPGEIAGFGAKRVLRSPKNGLISTVKKIGDCVEAGDVVALVEDVPMKAEIKGIVRGLLRNGTEVWKGMKAGDIDPRGTKEYCYTISDKARAVGGGVLEGILYHFNR